MDVALIQWPSDETLRVRFAQQGHPRLLLVAPDADPPICVDALEDWVRLPVSRSDRTARIRALEERAGSVVGEAPVVSKDGELIHRRARTQLSEIQSRVMGALVDRFGMVVGRDELSARAWPGADATENNLDVTVARLRRQVEDVGLVIKTIRSRGYLLCDSADLE